VRRAKCLEKALENAGIGIAEIEESEPGIVTLCVFFLPSASIFISVYERPVRRKRAPLARIKMNDLEMITIHDMLVPESEVVAEVNMLIARKLKLEQLQRQVQELREKLKAA
jgi:hypothetical protein